jgi:hypothetical protein
MNMRGLADQREAGVTLEDAGPEARHLSLDTCLEERYIGNQRNQ